MIGIGGFSGLVLVSVLLTLGRPGKTLQAPSSNHNISIFRLFPFVTTAEAGGIRGLSFA